MQKNCGKVKIKDVNCYISCCGWVKNYRIFGKIIFIDLKDQSGIIQIVFKNSEKKIFKKALSLRNEFCIKISGVVKKRKKNKKNFEIKTGKLEIFAKKLKIYNKSKKNPLSLNLEKTKNEKNNLKFRYLFIRTNKKILKNLKTKNRVLHIVQNILFKKKFLNIETPILTKSTPEGARDYLVPSRIKKKNFYALPQSPQIFKQLLMIGGINKYYQIARCFRDEDFRSNRQPEFTQIDLEASFINSNYIMKISEIIIKKIWKKIKNITFKKIPKISFKKSIIKFGSEKPDLRMSLKIKNLEKIFCENTSKKIKIYKLSLKFPKALFYKKKIIDKLLEIFKKKNIKNVTIIHIENISKKKFSIFGYYKNFFKKQKNIFLLIKFNKAIDGDVIFFASSKKKNIYLTFGKIRNKIISFIIKKKKIDLWKPVWITKFPMFKKKKKMLCSVHHPFTAPLKKYKISEIIKNPTKIITDSYDLIINGSEIGGGSVRIYKKNMQVEIFNILGINKKIQKKNFNFFLKSLEYGAPPHAGIAFGLERIIMLLNKLNSIKDTIAFPKSTSAFCYTTNSPSIVNKNYLKELGIKF